MIVPITGNVKFKITLDPTVWIFDDRKIKFEDAFKENDVDKETDELNYSSDERYNREIFQASNENKPISKADGKEILQSSYVISLEPFLKTAEIADDATGAALGKVDGSEEQISLEVLKNTYLLFSWNGKPLKEDGPVHVYFMDGSNKHDPIKEVNKIIIK